MGYRIMYGERYVDFKLLKLTGMCEAFGYTDNGPSGLEIQIWESLAHSFQISHGSRGDIR